MTRKKLPASLRLKICERQNWLCACCAKPFHWTHEVEIDHHQALVHGGGNTPDNLRALLKACHKKKTAADVAANAKVKRLQKKRGPRLNARARAIAKWNERKAMP